MSLVTFGLHPPLNMRLNFIEWNLFKLLIWIVITFHLHHFVTNRWKKILLAIFYPFFNIIKSNDIQRFLIIPHNKTFVWPDFYEIKQLNGIYSKRCFQLQILITLQYYVRVNIMWRKVGIYPIDVPSTNDSVAEAHTFFEVCIF